MVFSFNFFEFSFFSRAEIGVVVFYAGDPTSGDPNLKSENVFI